MKKKYTFCKKDRKGISLAILCAVLSLTFFITGCQKQPEDAKAEAAQEAAETDKSAPLDGGVLGEGSREFVFTVTGQDGDETEFEIHTDKETVGEALEEVGLIAGEESEYGLYVKTVNGVTADYDTDGKYWAFYINDEYAQTGVDAAEIKEGETYSFRME